MQNDEAVGCGYPSNLTQTCYYGFSETTNWVFTRRCAVCLSSHCHCPTWLNTSHFHPAHESQEDSGICALYLSHPALISVNTSWSPFPFAQNYHPPWFCCSLTSSMFCQIIYSAFKKKSQYIYLCMQRSERKMEVTVLMGFCF